MRRAVVVGAGLGAAVVVVVVASNLIAAAGFGWLWRGES